MDQKLEDRPKKSLIKPPPAAEAFYSEVLRLMAKSEAAPPPAPVQSPAVETPKPVVPRDGLDESAELFRSVFKGEIIP